MKRVRAIHHRAKTSNTRGAQVLSPPPSRLSSPSSPSRLYALAGDSNPSKKKKAKGGSMTLSAYAKSFAPEVVTESILASKVTDKTIFIANNPPRTLEEQSQPTKRRRIAGVRSLSAREKRELDVFAFGNISSSSPSSRISDGSIAEVGSEVVRGAGIGRYEDWTAVHSLWKQYVVDVLQNSRGDAALTKLLKMDLHGAEMTGILLHVWFESLICSVIRAKRPQDVGVCGYVFQETKLTFRIIDRNDRVYGKLHLLTFVHISKFTFHSHS